MRDILLSIVVPSHSRRHYDPPLAPTIIEQLDRQVGGHPEIEILCLVDNGRMSIGRKMNLLNNMARGRYIAGCGDDDEVTEDYVETLLGAIKHNDVDVVSFNHDYYIDGEFKAVIRESVELTYSNSWEKQEFTRIPSNKCAIRADLCREFEYPDKWHGEDTDFAKWVLPHLKSEHYIDRTIYKYLYRGPNKRFRREQEAVCRK